MMKNMIAVWINAWLGLQIGFGYVVAPILFAHLERMTAGQVAGQLFHITQIFGLIAWALAWQALGGSFMNRHLRKWLLMLLILLCVNEFAITPVIADLKAGATPVLVRWFGGDFKVWHGVSSVVYLLQTLLGLGLAAKLTRLRSD